MIKKSRWTKKTKETQRIKMSPTQDEDGRTRNAAVLA